MKRKYDENVSFGRPNKVLLELFPHNLPFINLLLLSKVIPPYICSLIQIKYRNPFLHVLELVLDLEILPHPKNLSVLSLTIFFFTIKSGRFGLLKFCMCVDLENPLPLIPMRRRDWIFNGVFRGIWITIIEF